MSLRTSLVKLIDHKLYDEWKTDKKLIIALEKAKISAYTRYEDEKLLLELQEAKTKEALDATLSKLAAIKNNSEVYLGKVLDPPKYTTKLHYVYDIYRPINALFEDLFGYTPKNLFTTDTYQYGIDRKDVTDIINKYAYQIDQGEYTPVIHDCDDFASEMKGFWEQASLAGFCVGYGLSKSHAFNWFIDNNKEFWILEPQNGLIFKPKRNLSTLYRITRYWV